MKHTKNGSILVVALAFALGACGAEGMEESAGVGDESFAEQSQALSGWETMPGLAKDVGVGTDSLAWIIGTNAVGGGDFGIYKFDGTTFVGTSGGAVRIAAGPSGVPWIVNAAGQIYRRTSGSPTSGSWTLLPGAAKDIGVGQDGTAWIIGTDALGGGDFGIYKWDSATSNWTGVSGGALRIAVGPTGVPWVLTAAGQIYRRTSNSATSGSWTLLAGAGKDIGIGSGTGAYLIGTNSVGGGDFGIYAWDGVSSWTGVSGGAVSVSVGPSARPWVVNSGGQIFRGIP